ncbi:hypothetical protein [Anaerolentibacter hominis]|uniref:hypothetical protein n=1 Tax=Anaerolentibacter hominis TaxID=3079009 RepID=UPI0031B881CC
MVTAEARNGKYKEFRGGGSGQGRPGQNRMDQGRPGQGQNRPGQNRPGQGRPNGSGAKYQSGGRNKPEGGYRGGAGDKRKPFHQDRFFDKDGDEEKKFARKTVKKDVRKTSGEDEGQADKIEVMKRLEREKKVKQRKQEHDGKERPVKAHGKQKNGKNIDWTRGYQNGLYGDDDESYTEFL